MSKKLVTVFGATGRQGGSVARALLADDNYDVRAITRNAGSAAALKLKELGAEICQADFEKPETLSEAVKDAYACFIMTESHPHYDEQRETDQGIAVLEACKQAGVQYIIFSGCESSKEKSGVSVPHMDGKAVVEQKVKDSGIPHTIVRVAFYYENFPHLFVDKAKENKFGIGIPMSNKPLYLIHIAGLGDCVRAILSNTDVYRGKTLEIASDMLSSQEIVDIFNKTFGPGKEFFNTHITADVFEAIGFPGSVPLANMFRFLDTEGRTRDIDLTRKLSPYILSFSDWMLKNKDENEKVLNAKNCVSE